MKYWDASAFFPILVEEPRTPELTDALMDDPLVVTWWGTVVECASGLAMRRRRDAFGAAAHDQALATLRAAFQGWRIIEPSEALRFEAMVLLRLHSLRAGDALQLAAALEWAEHRPSEVEFVCLDQRLREAAASHGFRILPA